MEQTMPPTPADDAARAIDRAKQLAPEMVEILAGIAASPESPRGSTVRARSAVVVLEVSGLVSNRANSVTVTVPGIGEDRDD